MTDNEDLDQDQETEVSETEVEELDMEESTETQAKEKKPKKEKGGKPEKKDPGFFAKIGKWFHELRIELKKVQWPTAKQTANNVVIVIVCVIVVGVWIWIFDSIAGGVVSALLNLFGKV